MATNSPDQGDPKRGREPDKAEKLYQQRGLFDEYLAGSKTPKIEEVFGATLPQSASRSLIGELNWNNADPHLMEFYTAIRTAAANIAHEPEALTEALNSARVPIRIKPLPLPELPNVPELSQEGGSLLDILSKSIVESQRARMNDEMFQDWERWLSAGKRYTQMHSVTLNAVLDGLLQADVAVFLPSKNRITPSADHVEVASRIAFAANIVGITAVMDARQAADLRNWRSEKVEENTWDYRRPEVREHVALAQACIAIFDILKPTIFAGSDDLVKKFMFHADEITSIANKNIRA